MGVPKGAVEILRGRYPRPFEWRDEHGAADEPLRALLRTTAGRRVARLGVPGAQVAVRRGGELLWSGCTGRLAVHPGPDDAAEVRREDRFVVASVTKLVVAATTMSLVERGELDLDAPVAQELPELPQGDPITVRMLLGHRSGLPDYFRDDAVRRTLATEPFAAWSRGELLQAIGRVGREGPPDRRFAYRNANYIAVGELLARSTGRTVGELVAERVARPLGLRSLSFEVEGSGVGRLAAPHRRRLWRPVDVVSRTGGRLPTHALGDVWTDGGLATSAEDLATLTEALFEGRLLPGATVEDMTRRSALPGSAVGGVLGALQTLYLGRVRRSYGLGVAVEERACSTTWGHEGMYLGWSATTTYDPRTRVTITVTANLAAIPVPAERLERSLRDLLARSPGG